MMIFMSKSTRIDSLIKVLLTVLVLSLSADGYGASSIVEGAVEDNAAAAATDYGVDVSFPIHYSLVQPSEIFGGTNKQTSYDKFLNSCRDRYGDICDHNELSRIELNRNQPSQMRNFSDSGFTKIRCPDKVYSLLKEFWEKNQDDRRVEDWSRGSTITNHWLAPSYMVSVQNETLIGGGGYLERQIWNAARDTMKQWTGQKIFRDSSLYGIRIYEEGAILSSHVDRLPLVTSAIVCVDQDLDEPWPLEVIGHDGRAHNVTMLPGDLVLYESHSIIHGRPFPLKGRFMANVFIHFYPVSEIEEAISSSGDDHQIELPLYILEGSAEADHWRNSAQGVLVDTSVDENGYTHAHKAADKGDISILNFILKKNPPALHLGDANGWQPIHFAVRSGRVEVVKFLVENAGADVNYRTNDGTGKTALELALSDLPIDDELIVYLYSVSENFLVERLPDDTSVDESGYTHAHRAADEGDIKALYYILKMNSPALRLGDVNGWQPLHFAIRSGRVEAVKFLVENAGADILYRTNDGTGQTALQLAREYFPSDELTHYLHSVRENLLDGDFSASDEL